MIGEYRRELTHRFGLLGFFCFAVGLSTGYVWWHVFAIALIFLFVTTARARVVVVVAGVIGMWLAVRPPTLEFDQPRFDKELTVVSMPYDFDSSSWVVAISQGKRYGVLMKGSAYFVPGEVIHAAGKQVAVGESRSTPNGLVAELEPVGRVDTVRTGLELLRIAVEARRRFVALTTQALPPDVAAAVDAMCMGSGSGLDDDQWEVFKRTGTVHVVVASGMHAAIAAGLVLGGMRFFPWRRHWKLLLALTVILIYAMAAGFRPPIVRGLVMTSLGAIHYLFSKEEDGLNSIGVAALVALAFDRWAVFDAGLWLSVTAVGSLELFGRPRVMMTLKTAREWLVQSFEASAVATTATAPLLAWYFGQVSLVGVAANLVALPALEAALGGSLLAYAVSFVSWPLGVVVMQSAVQSVIGGLVSFLQLLSTLPFAVVTFGAFSPYWLIPIYLGLLLFWRPRIVRAD